MYLGDKNSKHSLSWKGKLLENSNAETGDINETCNMVVKKASIILG